MDQTSLVQRVLTMTEAIQHAAQLADWETAARLTTEREPLVHAISAQQTPQALAMVRRIQAIDAAVAQDAETTQTELGREYRAAMDRLRAANAYQLATRL